jgi:hypothetical protein
MAEHYLKLIITLMEFQNLNSIDTHTSHCFCCNTLLSALADGFNEVLFQGKFEVDLISGLWP